MEDGPLLYKVSDAYNRDAPEFICFTENEETKTSPFSCWKTTCESMSLKEEISHWVSVSTPACMSSMKQGHLK